ncbi:MAG: hypothetical protein ACHQ50_15945 [Fimbriimonadales bacterium]
MTKQIDPRLVGRWISDPDGRGAGREETVMEFLPDGSLTYSILGKVSDEVMLLTFQTENGVIVSDQPSAARQERSPYTFTEDGKLMLAYDGILTVYSRKKP